MQLENAFLYERRIDQQTYERQRDALRESITAAEIASEDAAGNEPDVVGLLEFAERLLGNLSDLWLTSSLDDRQRIQSAVFPEGLPFANGRIGTSATCSAFKHFERIARPDSGMASPAGFEPAF